MRKKKDEIQLPTDNECWMKENSVAREKCINWAWPLLELNRIPKITSEFVYTTRKIRVRFSRRRSDLCPLQSHKFTVTLWLLVFGRYYSMQSIQLAHLRKIDKNVSTYTRFRFGLTVNELSNRNVPYWISKTSLSIHLQSRKKKLPKIEEDELQHRSSEYTHILERVREFSTVLKAGNIDWLPFIMHIVKYNCIFRPFKEFSAQFICNAV